MLYLLNFVLEAAVHGKALRNEIAIQVVLKLSLIVLNS